MDCLFCKIAAGEIPSQKAYEDAEILIFHDIAPAAPVHLLAIPKKHIASPAQIGEEDALLVGKLLLALQKTAEGLGLTSGYRIVANCGEDGGQTVGHLHFHLLGGKAMGWPPFPEKAV